MPVADDMLGVCSEQVGHVIRSAEIVESPVEKKLAVDPQQVIGVFADVSDVVRDENDGCVSGLIEDVSGCRKKNRAPSGSRAAVGSSRMRSSGFVNEGPGDEHTLLLAPGEFTDAGILESRDPEQVENPIDGLLVRLREIPGESFP